MTRYRDPPSARVLLADPPWMFGDKLPGDGRGAEKNYDVLSVESISKFPLPPIADDAMLLMWRVASMLDEALSVVRACGFVPKSEIVWVKTTRPIEPRSVVRVVDDDGERQMVDWPLPLWFGMGRSVRMAHESCIIAKRGKWQPKSRSIRSVFFAQAEKKAHSKKPDAFYSIIEELSDGPYAELFARHRRAGWMQFGNQLPDGESHP